MKEILNLLNQKKRMQEQLNFSGLITTNKHNPWTTINQHDNLLPLISPPPQLKIESEDCEMYLLFFVNKINRIRSNIVPPSSSSDLSDLSSRVLNVLT